MDTGPYTVWSWPVVPCEDIYCTGVCWSPIETITWGKIKAVYRGQ